MCRLCGSVAPNGSTATSQRWERTKAWVCSARTQASGGGVSMVGRSSFPEEVRAAVLERRSGGECTAPPAGRKGGGGPARPPHFFLHFPFASPILFSGSPSVLHS